METPCWSPSGWALTQQAETKRNICHRVLLEKRKFIQRGIQKHESNTFSNTRNVQMAKFPEISHLFNQHGSTLGRHVNTLTKRLIFFLRKRWENQSSEEVHASRGAARKKNLWLPWTCISVGYLFSCREKSIKNSGTRVSPRLDFRRFLECSLRSSRELACVATVSMPLLGGDWTSE